MNDKSNNRYDEPEDIRKIFDQANQNLADYEPDPNYEPGIDEPETVFEIPPELEGVIESSAIRNIRSVGKVRTSIQITMSSKLRNQWYDFVEVLTGSEISPGRTSASAPLVTLSMRLLMALVAEFEVADIIADLRKILGHGGAAKLNGMLKKLLERA